MSMSRMTRFWIYVLAFAMVGFWLNVFERQRLEIRTLYGRLSGADGMQIADNGRMGQGRRERG